MRSLATEALKVVNSKDTLREVVETCNSTPVLSDACSKSADFWKDTLVRLHGTVGTQMILQRGDLVTGAEWQLFCDGLVKGFAFKYVTNVNGGNVRPKYATPVKGIHDIDIDGVLPLPGTNGIWVDVEVNGRQGNQPRDRQTFFGLTLDQCVKYLAQWLFQITVQDAAEVRIDVDGVYQDFEMDNENSVELVRDAIEKKIIKHLKRIDRFLIDDLDGKLFSIQIRHFVFK